MVSFFNSNPVANHSSPTDVAAGATSNYSNIVSAIRELAITASRHTTAVAEYDQYLCHNQLVQRDMSTIETARYALEALDAAAHPDDRQLVDVFARVALERSLEAATAIFGSRVQQHPELTSIPHPSSSATLSIDYRSLSKAQNLAHQLYLSPKDGLTDAQCGCNMLGEFFGKESQRVKAVNWYTKNPLHLHPVHSNVLANAIALENELAAFPSAVLKIVDGTDALQAQKAAVISAELLANVAVLHRATAAMTMDPEGEGRVQASLAPTFCSLSARRRAEALRALIALKASGKTKVLPLDDAAVHPSQFEEK